MAKEGEKLNFTHQKVNKLNFGSFPLHCIPASALGGKKKKKKKSGGWELKVGMMSRAGDGAREGTR